MLLVAVETSYGDHYAGILSLNPAETWKSPESLFTYGNPAVIDFTSIRNGSIDGRLDFTIGTGSMDIDLEQVFLLMEHASS
jgi:hypothetical protein